MASRRKAARQTVAMLVEQDYQDLEVWYPILRLREHGCRVRVVGSGSAGRYTGKFGYPVDVDTDVSRAKPGSFDAVIIPGGWAPDFMRRVPRMIAFVREANAKGKIIAAICHAGWMLASAGVATGRTLTSFSAIRDDLENAGASWVDRECVVDGNLITARKPEDLPAFCKAIIEALGPAAR